MRESALDEFLALSTPEAKKRAEDDRWPTVIKAAEAVSAAVRKRDQDALKLAVSELDHATQALEVTQAGITPVLPHGKSAACTRC